MPIRNILRSAALSACALLLTSACALSAVVPSAEQFMAGRKTFSAGKPILEYMKANPQSYIGKVVELTGKVTGVMASGETKSFLLDCSGEALVIKAGKDLPDCLTSGNSVRALIRVGRDSVLSLSDLELLLVSYEYDVARLEQKLADEKAAKAAAPSTSPGTSPAASGARVKLSSRAKEVYEPYRKFIARLNPKLSAGELETITSSVLAYSEGYGVDPRLVVALIIAESNFKPGATSRCGAMGLGQLMPGTARGMGVNNAYDPEQNIEASVRLMKGHLSRYGDLALALSAYNAGLGR